MVFSLLQVLMFLENIFDGSAVHVMLLNLPLTAVSGAYRRVGPVCQVVFCFQWIRFVLETLPRPKKGWLGRLFKGALLGLVGVEYLGWKWLSQILPKTSYSQVRLGESARPAGAAAEHGCFRPARDAAAPAAGLLRREGPQTGQKSRDLQTAPATGRALLCRVRAVPVLPLGALSVRR